MSIMRIGDFTVWSDPETMTTTVSVDGRTEQVTQTVGEMLEILGRYMTQLQDENAKLRKELESVGTAAYLYGRSDLKTENDKLRELVRELYEDQRDECDRWKYRDRMRELGVEVNHD